MMAMGVKTQRAAGFSLLEVIIALAILAMSLTALLQSQAGSINSAGRSRDITIASLLARAKMVDIEVELHDEGFALGVIEDEGDFSEEGHPKIKWKSKISEVELDLSGLAAMCEGFEEPSADEEGGGMCASMLGGADGMGGMLSNFTGEVGRSLRLAQLTVSWPNGKFTDGFEVRTLITRTDFGLQPDLGSAGSRGAPGSIPGLPAGIPGLSPGGLK